MILMEKTKCNFMERKIDEMKRITYICMFIFPFLLVVGMILCEDIVCGEAVSINEIFTIGEKKEIEVAYPRRGLVGSPTSAMMPYPEIRKPSSEADFIKRIVRITVMEKRQLETGGRRIVLRLDEIDGDGLLIREGLYFAYVDLTSEGVRLIGKDRDDNKAKPFVTEKTGRAGLPFPLLCMLPPTLHFEKTGDRTSYLDSSGWGCVWASVDPQTVKATVFEKIYSDRQISSPHDVRHYMPEKKTLEEAPSPEGIGVVISVRETQTWKDWEDWLWERMERFDKDGNIIMRCRQIGK